MEKEIPFGIKFTTVVNFIHFAFMVLISTIIIVGIILLGNEEAALGGKVVALILAILFTIPAFLIFWLNRELKKLNQTARIWQIVLSIFGIFNFPLGTVLHGIILYYMFGDEKTKQAFESGSASQTTQKVEEIDSSKS